MKQEHKLLIIGTVWPEPNSSAAGSRMIQLIELFQKQNWQVNFCSAAAHSEFMFDLESIGVIRHKVELNNNSFDDFIKHLNPAVVMFDRFMAEEQFGWRVAEHCPNAIRMLDTEDLHCLRLARELAHKENRLFIETDLFPTTAKREIASIYRCDISLIISEFEMNLLQNVFKIPQQQLHYLPFLLNEIDNQTQANWTKYENRNDFIFIGNFYHHPNVDAVNYLKQNIWPIIKKQLPTAQLNVYGAYASSKITQLHNAKEGFNILGRATNVFEVMQNAKICLAPLRFGAGIKGKITDAMQCGTPTVTTSIGAESMYGEMDWCGAIENDAAQFASAAVELCSNKNLWLQSQLNGKNIINKRYNKHIFESDFITRIFALQNKLDTERQHNFIGSMLLHHTMNSTKYMARWIEEKNK